MKRKLIIGLVLGVVVIVVIALIPSPMQRRLHSPERKRWKDQAISQIAATTRDLHTFSNELATLSANSTAEPEDGWIGTNLIVMTNGEWLLYQNNCVKEPNHLHDLFLARGSDGKWYYSTFHFCTGMVVVRGRMFGDTDHGSIAEFTRTYFARQFDGKSDECLNKTYPVGK